MKYAIKKFHVYENGTEVLTTESFESGEELFSKYTLPQLTGDIFFSHVEREDGHKLSTEELQKLYWNFGIDDWDIEEE